MNDALLEMGREMQRVCQFVDASCAAEAAAMAALGTAAQELQTAMGVPAAMLDADQSNYASLTSGAGQ